MNQVKMLRIRPEMVGREQNDGVPPGQHCWITAVSFRLHPAEVMSGELRLTERKMCSVSPVGCYTCEKPFTEELAKLPCPGEPEDSVKL